MRTWLRTPALLRFAFLAVFSWLVAGPLDDQGTCRAAQSVAMHGQPRLGPPISAFPYANQNAVTAGSLVQAVLGTFDSVNPFIVKGVSAVGVRELVYESLMKRSLDEPFSLYGLVAENIELNGDRTRVSFRLRGGAHFSDGVPITAADVEFSLQTLKREGRPLYREYYSKVLKIERPDPLTITFSIDPGAHDRELPLILSLMPILPKHVFEHRPFNATTLTAPIGSGPYRVQEVVPGQRIVFARDANYWGTDLWVNRGANNFARVRFDYFRDETTAFEALKAGLIDIWVERDPVRWADSYDFAALQRGLIRRMERPNNAPADMYGFAFNTRREDFADPRIRRALVLLFDFPMINQMLLRGAFQRIESYFDHSELAAKGPASPEEIVLLAPFAKMLREETLQKGWIAPSVDPRVNRRAALALLEQAGYVLKGGQLVRLRDGKPLQFELLLKNPAEERIAIAYRDMLKRAGISLDIRTTDAIQFESRRRAFDYDLISFRWIGSPSPGNEQAFYWGSRSADQPGSKNVAGVRSPAADAMIARLLSATTREDLRTAVRALDRVLLSGDYVLPLFYLPTDWLAVKSKLRFPSRELSFGFDPLVTPLLWWWDSGAPQKE